MFPSLPDPPLFPDTPPRGMFVSFLFICFFVSLSGFRDSVGILSGGQTAEMLQLALLIDSTNILCTF